MNIKMQVEYEREEVYAILIAAHAQKFCAAPTGYHYACSGYYSDITVQTVKNEDSVPNAETEKVLSQMDKGEDLHEAKSVEELVDGHAAE